ncbi:hypothetical protein [Pseudomonas taiwanensis]|uniref:hypothetical protein n=1 Tax=Pseudomonas taiwanensis TaxID=470150 RepID=UPI0028E2923A|nr:hypothetical protein [Pseudomonas taiwanensis]
MTERQNEQTRQKAGFSGVPEILKAFYGTLNGAAPGVKNCRKYMIFLYFSLLAIDLYLDKYPYRSLDLQVCQRNSCCQSSSEAGDG